MKLLIEMQTRTLEQLTKLQSVYKTENTDQLVQICITAAYNTKFSCNKCNPSNGQTSQNKD